VDKLLHFVAGAAITLIVIVGIISICITLGYSYNPILVITIGLLIGAAAGILKEWLDSKGSGTPELLDFIATVLGSLLVTVIFLIIL